VSLVVGGGSRRPALAKPALSRAITSGEAWNLAQNSTGSCSRSGDCRMASSRALRAAAAWPSAASARARAAWPNPQQLALESSAASRARSNSPPRKRE
jgi:hypothetical protein